MPESPDTTGLRIEIPRDVLRDAIALGIERACGDGIRAETRAFLEEYFGVLTKEETAAMLGISERTVEALWADQTLPKDTALGERMPRTWLPAIKEVIAAGRLKSRAPKASLMVVRRKAA